MEKEGGLYREERRKGVWGGGGGGEREGERERNYMGDLATHLLLKLQFS